MAAFKPVQVADSANLENLELEDGQFIVTLDTKKMYVDALMGEQGEEEIERLALGGEIDLSDYVTTDDMNTTLSDYITETQLQEAIAGIEPSFDFSSLSDSLTGGTLTNISITPNTSTETFDISVTMPTIAIDSSTEEWTINGQSTGVSARGPAGQNGTNGQDGITPIINPTSKHWIIGETDTLVVAEGQNGVSPTVTFSPILNGNRMTVTDSAGSSYIDITNGIAAVQGTVLQGTVTALDWIGNSAPYSQRITINGLTSELTPVIDVILSNIIETALNEEKQWGYITKAETGSNSITLYCYKTKPTIDLNFIMKVI